MLLFRLFFDMISELCQIGIYAQNHVHDHLENIRPFEIGHVLRKMYRHQTKLMMALL